MLTRRKFLVQTASGIALTAVSAAQAAKDTMVSPRRSMKTYRIPHTDLVVSRIAYGIAMLGVDWRNADLVATSVQAINTALDNGINFFDLADTYGLGQSESALGKVLRQSPGLRSRIVIQSKCGQRLAEGWVPGDPIREDTFGVDLSREHIVRSAEGSLERLGTDHLDILLLHYPDTLVQPQEVAQAYDDLHRSGKVRHFGVSNHGSAQIELLKRYVRQPLVINQIWAGLGYVFPFTKSDVVDYCRLHDIQVQAFSPLKVSGGAGKPSTLLNPPSDASAEFKRMAQVLLDLAKEKDTNPSAIALAWLLHHPAGIVPVIGASNPVHIADNCAADRVSLSDREWYALLHSAAGIQPEKPG